MPSTQMTRISLLLALAIAPSCTAWNIVTAPIDAIVREETTPGPIARAADQACLQEAIYFESGNSDLTGRVAVGHVILNRVADDRFPSTICGVIAEGQSEGRCQFSYRCDLDVTDIRWPGQHATAGETATAILSDSTEDPTDGALFFHSASIAPGWFATRERRGNFGGNIFYR